MIRQIYIIYSYIGCAPLFENDSKKNIILPMCLIVCNQIRFMHVIYYRIARDTDLLDTSVLYAALVVISSFFENISISVILYSTTTKSFSWKQVNFLMRNEEPLNADDKKSLIWIALCSGIYISVIISEYMFIERGLTGTYFWLTYHLCQWFMYLYLYFVCGILRILTKEYVKFKKNFLYDMTSFQMRTRQAYIDNGKRYFYLLRIAQELNKLFGVSLLAVLSKLFINILSGISYVLYLKYISEKTYLWYIGTYVAQGIFSMVSSHILNSYITL